ncbi:MULTISPECIES: hypothetical protein [unclassified Mycobacterium]|uniref:hypothetical protein n=1 Tax=unclassified Mycobacterium TaxID=2642494 RepID=UPI000991B13A|nr:MULTISPECIES: hypothetical protein [unclassified Mycobacterium]
MSDFDLGPITPSERQRLQEDMNLYLQIDRLPETRAEMEQLLLLKELDIDVDEACTHWLDEGEHE